MTEAKEKGKDLEKHITISAPNLVTASFKIVGLSPLVMHKFSHKAKEKMIRTQEAGSTAKSKRAKEAKNFDEECEAAKHVSREGWAGIPAPAFRNAMIDACRMVGFKMTVAKMSVFVEADGFDPDDGTPLVKITKGKPHRMDSAVRLETGVIDIHPRPTWDEGWEATVRVRFDADQFTLPDVGNLLMRAGSQVGILEGRPFSKNSAGCGWGLFKLAE